MINIEKAEKEFEKYTNIYNIDEEPIKRKIYHTFRVEKLCEKIAISLGMNQEEIILAKLIGLLHDIGRFEQYTKYGTFSDLKSVDHANLGISILNNNNYIKEYTDNEEYIKIIEKAIYYHNKYKIEKENLNNNEEIFCKIIRDADKLDIIYETTTIFWNDKLDVIGTQEISKEVFDQIMKHELIDRKNVNTNLDEVLVNMAFIYDFNFKESYKIMQKDSINKAIDKFKYNQKNKEKMVIIKKELNEFIKSKISNND